MWFMNWIVDRLNGVSGLFYELYYDCYYVGWPLDVLADWFYYLAGFFSELAWDFSDFGTWVNTVAPKIADMLNWTTVWSNIVSIVPNLEDIRDWFYNITGNILSVVYDWWSITSTAVLGWIDATKDWARLWIDYLQGQVDELRVMIQDLPGAIPDLSFILEWFTDWPGNVRAVIDTWWTSTMGDVQGLIDSSLKTWFPFYDDLVGLWSGIKEFFTDPEDWLYKSFDRIIERYW